MTEVINLSSNPLSQLIFYPIRYLSDIIKVEVNFSSIDLSKILVGVKIDWGDNTSTIQIKTDNINKFNYTYKKGYSQQIDSYFHVYEYSKTSLIKELSCQFLLSYIDGSSCRFVQPLTIVSPSFYNKIEDLYLLENNILEDKSILYTFISKKNNQVIESVYSELTI